MAEPLNRIARQCRVWPARQNPHVPQGREGHSATIWPATRPDPSGAASTQALISAMDAAARAGAVRLRVLRLEARP